MNAVFCFGMEDFRFIRFGMEFCVCFQVLPRNNIVAYASVRVRSMMTIFIPIC